MAIEVKDLSGRSGGSRSGTGFVERGTVGDFDKTVFPHPGYVAQDVIFRREKATNSRPLARIEKITCRARAALQTFTHRITRMDLEHP
jgi:hypothetical protein